MNKDYIEYRREVDNFICALLESDMDIHVCKAKLIEKYPSESKYFDIFVEEYMQ